MLACDLCRPERVGGPQRLVDLVPAVWPIQCNALSRVPTDSYSFSGLTRLHRHFDAHPPIKDA